MSVAPKSKLAPDAPWSYPVCSAAWPSAELKSTFYSPRRRQAIRGRLPVLIVVGLVACATGEAANAPAPSIQAATWIQRKVHLDFGYAPLVISEAGPWQEVSCDRLYDEVKSALVQLGARESDLQVDQRGCYGARGLRSDDVVFSVLAPGKMAGGEWAEAHWETAALKGNCAFLEYVALKVLPLLSARNVQHLSKGDCDSQAVGLRADVLMPAQSATAP